MECFSKNIFLIDCFVELSSFVKVSILVSFDTDFIMLLDQCFQGVIT